MTHGVFTSKKEPSPIKTKRRPTWDFILDSYLKRDSYDPKVFEFMRERMEYGYKKHGSHLTPDNGRNDIVDLVQELADAIAYSKNKVLSMTQEGDSYERMSIVHESLISIMEECFNLAYLENVYE